MKTSFIRQMKKYPRFCWMLMACQNTESRTEVGVHLSPSTAQTETETEAEQTVAPIEFTASLESNEEFSAPQFEYTGPVPIPMDIRERMEGVSHREGCPLGFDELRFLQIRHWGIDGEVHTGELIVAASEADTIIRVFSDIFAAHYPIQHMRLVHEYGGDDNRSMADNNTSAFNCRNGTGSSSWSEHSYGAAIDINPRINPYVTPSGTVLPPEGAEFIDRNLSVPGLIIDGDAVVRAFENEGWRWGGHWNNSKDYQHFSRSGR